MALSPAEKQAAYRAREAAKVAADLAKKTADSDKLIAANDRIRSLERTLQDYTAALRQSHHKNEAIASITTEEFKLVRSLLHPDRHPEDADKYNRAFEIFNRIPEPKPRKRKG